MTPKQIITRMQNYIKQNGYTQIPTLAFSKKDTLDNLLIGNDPDFNPNINIYLEGDKWCKDETQWNIFDIKNSKMLFTENRRFYMGGICNHTSFKKSRNTRLSSNHFCNFTTCTTFNNT